MPDYLKACKKTRKVAIDALYKILKWALKSKTPISEVAFRDKWLENLRKNKDIYPDGWYIPPPNGIGVLFGEAKRKGRQSYKTLRVEELWPKNEIFLGEENDMMYVYSSPVDKKTGIIGDIGLSIYLGKDQKVKNHLKKCFELNKKVFDYIEIGKTIKEVNKYAFKKMKDTGLTNDVVAIHDPSGSNIGHSVPIPDKTWTKKELELLSSKETKWEKKKDLISRKRFFFNDIEQREFSKGMAITIEPRMASVKNKDLPLTSFHNIVLIHNSGKKEFLMGYEKIFKLVGMDYLLK